MKKSNLRTAIPLMALLAGLILVSCDTTTTVSEGDPAFARGVITARGSIVVNGIEYDTSGAQITIDGEPGTEAQLLEGMKVYLKGGVDLPTDTGVADRVQYISSLVGPISSIGVESFAVLGQTVRTDAGTVFTDLPGGFDDLTLGGEVEVSGLPDENGIILATFIRTSGAAGTYSIYGTVSGLTDDSFTLTPPNGGTPLTVSVTSGALAGGIADGSRVVVEFSDFTPPSTVSADGADVSVRTPLGPDPDDHVEVEGFVTDLNTDEETFRIEGGLILADAVDLSGINNGDYVEVEGTCVEFGTGLATSAESITSVP